MRALIGTVLTAAGVILTFGAAIFDAIQGPPGLAFFFAGLALTAIGLTVRHGPGWADY